jgi:hypothetical protein
MPSSLLCGGDLYIDRLTSAGVETGLVPAGNCVAMSITPDAEIKEQRIKGRDNYGQVLASVTLNAPATLKVKLDQLDKTNLAMAFLGNEATLTEASGSSYADSDVVAIHDKWVPMDKRSLSSVVVKDVTDVTTYVLNTDYELDVRLGWIKVLSTGSIADGATLHVVYDHAEVTGGRVTGAVQPTIRAKLVLDGKNLVDGKDVLVTVYSARVKPTSEVDFMSDDFVALELEGTMETPTGYSEPFKVDLLD